MDAGSPTQADWKTRVVQGLSCGRARPAREPLPSSCLITGGHVATAGIKRLKVGRGAALLVDAEGERAFMSCTPGNDVAVVDLRALEVAGRPGVGGRPNDPAWAV